MAIVENRATEIGDVIRIETDVPIIGLISLTSFMDSTEGEELSPTVGTLPRYTNAQGDTPSFSRSIQVGPDRYSVADGTDLKQIIKLNLVTGVWQDNYPQSPDSINYMSYQNNVLYLFSRIYDADNSIYNLSVRELDLNTMTYSSAIVFNDTGSPSFWVTHLVYNDKIYYWARPSGLVWRLYSYDVVTKQLTEVNEYIEGNVQPLYPEIDTTNGKIYFNVSIAPGAIMRRLGVYDIASDEYTLLSPYEVSIGRMAYDADSNKVYSFDDRVITNPDGSLSRHKVLTYDVATDQWSSGNNFAPSTLLNINHFSYYNNRLYAYGGYFVTEVYTIATDTWATSGGNTTRFFQKMFRYSLDGGLNFTSFEELNDINIQNITVRQKDQFVLEVTYERSGNDATGNLAFNSFTLSGDFEELGFPIYDQTIFKKIFEVNHPAVLGWALNVLEKIYHRGLLPDYVDRNREDKDDTDFVVFWNSVTHLFALLVYFARNFESIPSNRLILIEYLNNFDILIPFDQNLEDMGFIFSNRPDEYRRRGTDRIKFAKGENNEGIDGELLRELNTQDLDLLLFALIEAHKFGWCLGESSPTWTGTENITNLTLGYEFTKSVNDLASYPLIDESNISLYQDATINSQVMRISGHSNSGSNTGIGLVDPDNPSADDLIIVDPNISYEISFKVKKSNTNNDYLDFGAYGYNENINRINLQPISVSTVNPNNFFSTTTNNHLLIENEYYWYRGVLFASGTDKSDDLILNFPNGRGLLLTNDIKYIGVYIYARDASSLPDLFIYDIKIRPLDLPISQGLFGIKNIIVGYLKNNGELSDENLRLFTQNRLIPYNSFLVPKFL